ncbi:hypothetical protein ACOSQ2_028532 [Xanthoceras sorbifolium]
MNKAGGLSIKFNGHSGRLGRTNTGFRCNDVSLQTRKRWNEDLSEQISKPRADNGSADLNTVRGAFIGNMRSNLSSGSGKHKESLKIGEGSRFEVLQGVVEDVVEKAIISQRPVSRNVNSSSYTNVKKKGIFKDVNNKGNYAIKRLPSVGGKFKYGNGKGEFNSLLKNSGGGHSVTGKVESWGQIRGIVE